MAKKNLLFILLLIPSLVQAQLYKKPVYPNGYFRWPTELKPDIVANMGELRPNHWHMGLDVRTNQVVNQRVVAAADGYIAFVGIEPLSWGRWIIINHPNGLSTLYGHLNDFRPDLEAYVTQQQYANESWETHLTIPVGKFPVKKGDFISYSGTTGGSQGPHVHWEIMNTKSAKRLNPLLFGVPWTDSRPPTLVRLAMYDRNNSTYDQTPRIYRLTKNADGYTVNGGIIQTNLDNIGFAIQAYDTWNSAGNQDGIYSARIFLDNKEISSFYIDSITYEESRFINAQVDYKTLANGGASYQHINKLPGDHSGIYYSAASGNTIILNDTAAHAVRILISDAAGNISTINFKIKNDGQAPPAKRNYDWQPNRLNRIFNANFEAYIPMYVLYDKMNPGYQQLAPSSANSVSARHKLGETDIPAHSNFEVRIKPAKTVSPELKDKIVIKQVGRRSGVQKAKWYDGWLSAQFRDFGTFEAFIDNTPPSISSSLGAAERVDLSRTSRITITPSDNFGVEDFRAEVDGKWLRFTNDKGRTWVYNFDGRIGEGEHTLKVTVTDIAGNKAQRTWTIYRSSATTLAPVKKAAPVKKKSSSKRATVSKSKKPAVKSSGVKKSTTKKATSAKKSSSVKKKK